MQKHWLACIQFTGRQNCRKARGNSIVELPFVLWFVFICLLFPMVDLATAYFRSTFLYLAVHNAAINAARAPTFQTELNNQPSATETANTAITNAIGSVGGTTSGAFSGVTVENIATNIVITTISTDAKGVATNTVSSQSIPLTKPADDESNTYQIQVSVTASVSPLLTLPPLQPIPGLTEPMVVTMVDQQYVENPQGLTF